MNFFEFLCFDLICFGIKLIILLIIALLFKDKLGTYLLDKQFNESFGKVKDNIMSINFDDLDDSPSNTDLDHPKQF